MSFANYNGVVQVGNNSCGAFALAAALSDLKNLPLKRLDTLHVANRYSSNTTTPANFATSLYQITGCLLLQGNPLPPHNPPPSATYQYMNPVQNMNPPSALAYVACKNGVQPANIFVKYNNVASNLFQAYPVTNGGTIGSLLANEISIIGTAPIYGNPVGITDYIALPGANQAHLLLVGNFDHWVALNANEIYDPATGFVGPYVTTPHPVNAQNPLTRLTYNNGDVHNLNFCGLWMEMS
jgi:hypothetical protein